MNTSQVISANRLSIVFKFLCFLAVVFFAPFIGNQFITGTIVNASLIVSFFVFGLGGAILLCFLPSAISLTLGFMSLPIMIPFIVLGNIILILSFRFLKNYWLGLIMGALFKFSFLFLITNFIIKFFVSSPILNKISIMMSWPQLVTACLGGFIAYFIIKRKKLDF
jgi:hypothetical protein